MLGVQLTILYFCLLPSKSCAQVVLRQKGKNNLLKVLITDFIKSIQKT